MAGWMAWIWGRKDAQQMSRDVIVGLRHQLQMIGKKEEYLLKKVEEEMAEAKANAMTNKPAVSLAALKRKKMLEIELEKLHGTKSQLEMTVNTLGSVKINREHIPAMEKAANALYTIHGDLSIDKVNKIIADLQEQARLATEVQRQISSGPICFDLDELKEDELKEDLAYLEQDELNEMLQVVEPVPIHLPPGATRTMAGRFMQPAELNEEEMLKKLLAELAM
ncbi:Snf7-domain-containing protein [Thelephora terrestris]|uniref:Vacuolar-sorting protein SNF7 n=1 Tax=Thelephora terrestris TaxID=56493 RepID=A0A9P6H9Z6_9AGAM|nr:Snf7-domain-containing protein [Thelephora terrestris]